LPGFVAFSKDGEPGAAFGSEAGAEPSPARGPCSRGDGRSAGDFISLPIDEGRRPADDSGLGSITRPGLLAGSCGGVVAGSKPVTLPVADEGSLAGNLDSGDGLPWCRGISDCG